MGAQQPEHTNVLSACLGCGYAKGMSGSYILDIYLQERSISGDIYLRFCDINLF